MSESEPIGLFGLDDSIEAEENSEGNSVAEIVGEDDDAVDEVDTERRSIGIESIREPDIEGESIRPTTSPITIQCDESLAAEKEPVLTRRQSSQDREHDQSIETQTEEHRSTAPLSHSCESAQSDAVSDEKSEDREGEPFRAMVDLSDSCF